MTVKLVKMLMAALPQRPIFAGTAVEEAHEYVMEEYCDDSTGGYGWCKAVVPPGCKMQPPSPLI